MTTRRLVLLVACIIIAIIAVVGIWTFYDAWQAGVLPWQPEPTRSVVTPFSNLPTAESTPGG